MWGCTRKSLLRPTTTYYEVLYVLSTTYIILVVLLAKQGTADLGRSNNGIRAGP